MKYSTLLSQLINNRESFFEAAKKKSKTLSDSIGLFPGGFKPPHKGHMSVVLSALNEGIEKVIILISSKSREGGDRDWDAKSSKEIWDYLLEEEGISNKVEAQISKFPSPVLSAYKFLEEDSGISGKNIYMIKSTKDEGDTRFTESSLQKSLDKNPKKAASVQELAVSPLKDSGKTISSSDIRGMSKEDRKKMNSMYENNILDSIFEGGNVFKGTERATVKIPRDFIEPTIRAFAAEFKRIFPKVVLDFEDLNRVIRLGSVGKKDYSGDIDLGIDSSEVFDMKTGKPKFSDFNVDEKEFETLFLQLKSKARTATDGKLKFRSLLTLISNEINKKSEMIVSSDKDVGSGAIFSSFPQFDASGKKQKEFVQIDLNVGPLQWLKFSYYSSGSFKGNIKGLHRTQLIASIFDALNYSFKHEQGIIDKSTQEAIITDVAGVIDFLNKKGIKISADDINDFDKVMDAVEASSHKDAVLKAFLKSRLDTMRDADVPDRLQNYWLKKRSEWDLKGVWLPENSSIFDKLPPDEAAKIKEIRAQKNAEKLEKNKAALEKTINKSKAPKPVKDIIPASVKETKPKGTKKK
jgi:hypothetical protein